MTALTPTVTSPGIAHGYAGPCWCGPIPVVVRHVDDGTTGRLVIHRPLSTTPISDELVDQAADAIGAVVVPATVLSENYHSPGGPT